MKKKKEQKRNKYRIIFIKVEFNNINNNNNGINFYSFIIY